MIIDAHIHHYPDCYIDFLKQSTEPPYVINREGTDRLFMFSDTDNWKLGKGLKILPDFFSYEAKLEIMLQNHVDTSILSLGNPWLDFIPINQSILLAEKINNEISEICTNNPEHFWGLACLPAGDIQASINEVKRISDLPGIVGILISTKMGDGWFDGKQTLPFWELINKVNIPIFLHPYYSVGGASLANYDEMLRFSLGFPYETAFAATRLIMSGIIDQFPNLKILLAHAGGAFPSLIGRIEAYSRENVKANLRYPITEYLKFFYYDAITYSPELLRFLSNIVGFEKIIFGTDYPFAANETPLLVQTIKDAGFNRKQQELIFSKNAMSFFSK